MTVALRNFELAAQALSTDLVAGLAKVLGEVFADSAHSSTISSWVRFALSRGAAPPVVDGHTAPFIQCISELRQSRSNDVARAKGPSQRIVDENLDFLGDPSGCAGWIPVQYLNYLLMAEIRPQRHAAVVGTMRDDGIYAVEWIAHYLALGFEHVFIYTNDNVDGSEYLLRCLASNGVITLIESKTSGNVAPEIKAFEHLLQFVPDARDFEWLLFVDSDEFLFPAPVFGNSIKAITSALRQKYPETAPSAILFNWLWQVSGMVFERRPGLLMERFQHARPHSLTKTLVRSSDVISMRQQHYPELRSGRFVVDLAFEPFDLQHIWDGRPPSYEGGWISHYWPKSFEEFSLKKARGDALKMDANEYSRPFELFFQWNGLETASNHSPPNSPLIAHVKTVCSTLRTLQGVAEAEAEVERRFGNLLHRYDSVGGLKMIYDRAKRKPGAL